MKKLITIVLISFTILVSCEKEPDNGLEADISYRIKKEIQYKNGVESYNSTYTYGNEQLIMVLSDLKVEGQAKQEFFYENNKIIRITSIKYIDSWDWSSSRKNEYSLNNNNLMETLEYTMMDGNWKLENKELFQYENDNLITYQLYYDKYYSGNITLNDKYEFYYANNKLVELTYSEKDKTNNWNQATIQFFYTYSGKNIEKIEYYLKNSGETKPNGEINLYYTGDKISEIVWKSFDYKQNNWRIDNIVEFRYDYNGYLIEEIQNSGERRLVYEYEEGNGNAGLLHRDLFNYYYWLIPYPKVK